MASTKTILQLGVVLLGTSLTLAANAGDGSVRNYDKRSKEEVGEEKKKPKQTTDVSAQKVAPAQTNAGAQKGIIAVKPGDEKQQKVAPATGK